jgi:hypothetical protein
LGRFSRFLSRAVLIVCGLALAACSTTRLGYNYADWLVGSYASRYFDLDAGQRDWLRARMREHLAWHRSEELQNYDAILWQMRERARHGFGQDDVQWMANAWRVRYLVLAERIIPDVAELTSRLDARQLARFEARMEKDFARQRKDAAELEPMAARARRTIRGIEGWTGRLDEGQRARITALIEAFPEPERETDDELERRERRAAEYLAALREGRSALELEAMLREWWTGFLDSEGEVAPVQVSGPAVELLLTVDAMLTERQRARAVARIDRYRRDVAAMAGRELESGAH